MSGLNKQSVTTAKPHVVIVAHAIHEHGGMERAYTELIRRMQGRYRVTVVSSELVGSVRPLVEWRRVPVPRRPFPLRFVLFFLVGGIQVARVRGGLIHSLGAIVPNRVDVAELQFCHAGFIEATGHLAPADATPLRRLNTTLSRFLALQAERWCYRPTRLRRFAAASEGIAAELEKHYPGIPISVTPNGVDVERFRRDAGARAELRRGSGLADDEVVALFVGGDWDRKGLHVLIEALSYAPLVKLWVVGPGDRARAQRLAQRLGLEDRVRFFGPRADAERYYSAADIFCLPTLYEAFPLVALEAAAAGLALVTTQVNGVTELIGANEAGILVDRNPESVGVALGRLASDPDLREQLGTAASNRVARFTWDATAEAVYALDAELLASDREVRA